MFCVILFFIKLMIKLAKGKEEEKEAREEEEHG